MLPSSFRAVFLLLLLSYNWNSAAAETCYNKYEAPEEYWSFPSLHMAVEAEDYECVKELLDKDYSTSFQNRDDHTPLRIAAQVNNGEIARLLLSYGAFPNFKYGVSSDDVVIVDAACIGATRVVEALVDAGASPDIVGRALTDKIAAPEVACTCPDAPSDCPKSEILGLLNKPSIGVYFDHDFPSSEGVLNDGSKDVTANNRECHNKCLNTSGCKVWTRIKRKVSGDNEEGECWLRSYQPEAVKCDHCDSGVISCEVIDNTDYGILSPTVRRTYEGKTKSNQDCCALCYGTRTCKSWTRVKWNIGNNKKDECWLYSYHSEGEDNQATAGGHIEKLDD